MNRKFWVYPVLSSALLIGARAACAQEPSPEAAPPPILRMQAGMPEEGEPGLFEQRIELLGFGGLHGSKVVTGAPFSAVAVSESTQTLADGNHIARKTQTSLYRDSQGRFRKELALPAIGPLTASDGPHSFVAINDPVAGEGYILEPDNKVARKLPKPRGEFKNGPDRGPKDVIRYGSDAKKEDLGTQAVNGVSAQGTRVTRTIAAGEIGNDKPITIVSERWYSADLQMVVKSTHSDPRFGNTTYTLTSVQRAEPAASLFAVPADYTVKEGGPGFGARGREKFRGAAPPPPPGD